MNLTELSLQTRPAVKNKKKNKPRFISVQLKRFVMTLTIDRELPSLKYDREISFIVRRRLCFVDRLSERLCK